MPGTVYNFRIDADDFEVWKEIESDSSLYQIPKANLEQVMKRLSDSNYLFYVSRIEDENIGGVILHLLPETKSALVERIILPKNNLEVGRVTVRGSLPWFGTKQMKSVNALVIEKGFEDSFEYPTHIVIPHFTKEILIAQGFIEQNILYKAELDISSVNSVSHEDYTDAISDDDLDLVELKIKRKKYPHELIGARGVLSSTNAHKLYAVGEDFLGAFAVRNEISNIIEFVISAREQYTEVVFGSIITYLKEHNQDKLIISYISESDSKLLDLINKYGGTLSKMYWLRKEL